MISNSIPNSIDLTFLRMTLKDTLKGIMYCYRNRLSPPIHK